MITYAGRLPRIYSLIDLTHFSAGIEKIIYWHLYWNYDCANIEQNHSDPYITTH